MSTTCLEMKGICKGFYGVPVLQDVDFSLREGTVHALVGGNGAGKSTLVKIITGVYQRDAGEVTLHGRPVQFSSYDQATEGGIRMIFQEMSSVRQLTVAQNIFLNSEPRRGPFLDKKAMVTRTRDLLAMLGIHEIDPDEVLENLGVGQAQMIEIAKALAHEAKILIMDEPTASLTEAEVSVLFDLISRLKEQGISVIYISHRMNEILQVADDITVLRDGRRVVTRPRADMEMADIINYMLGEQHTQSFHWRPPQYKGPREPLLRVENLTMKNRLHDISFSLHRGEVIGIAGLMNSGRTEILESIFGIRTFDGGRILAGDTGAPITSTEDAIRAGIGLIPENRRSQGLILEHSLKQNMALPLLRQLTRGILLDDGALNRLSDDAIAELNIVTDGRDKQVMLLSGGNQQKIVFAKWFKANTRILLLDEPTMGIDVGAKSELINLVRAFVDEGNGAVIVSSEIQELLSISDRVLILNSGIVTREYTHEQIASEEVIQHAIQQ